MIFWVFDNEIVDKELEHLVFATLSDQGIGPKLYFWNETYRIEEYYVSRPCSVFELWNPVILKGIIDKIFAFNFNPTLKEKMK